MSRNDSSVRRSSSALFHVQIATVTEIGAIVRLLMEDVLCARVSGSRQTLSDGSHRLWCPQRQGVERWQRLSVPPGKTK
jgi:hypothetical protein